MNAQPASVSNAALLHDLARVKVLFQARTVAAVIGAPMPVVRDGCGELRTSETATACQERLCAMRHLGAGRVGHVGSVSL